MSLELLLAHCARRTLGPSATSDDLCHRLFVDPRSMIAEHFGALRAQAITVELPGFVRYPLPAVALPGQTTERTAAVRGRDRGRAEPTA